MVERITRWKGGWTKLGIRLERGSNKVVSWLYCDCIVIACGCIVETKWEHDRTVQKMQKCSLTMFIDIDENVHSRLIGTLFLSSKLQKIIEKYLVLRYRYLQPQTKYLEEGKNIRPNWAELENVHTSFCLIFSLYCQSLISRRENGH